MFNIVLVEPKIPQNTGTIGRLCVNLAATLHLVKPLGFNIDDKSLKRAGLDYWKNLKLVKWDSLEIFLQNNPISKNTHLATTKTDNLYFNASFKKNDYILFGSETQGLPEKLILDNKKKCISIPMNKEFGRSLNISISVGIISYEGLRQNFII